MMVSIVDTGKRIMKRPELDTGCVDMKMDEHGITEREKCDKDE